MWTHLDAQNSWCICCVQFEQYCNTIYTCTNLCSSEYIYNDYIGGCTLIFLYTPGICCNQLYICAHSIVIVLKSMLVQSTMATLMGAQWYSYIHQVVCCLLSMQGACANVCMSAVYNQLYLCAHALCSWSDALLHIVLSMKGCDVHYSCMMHMCVHVWSQKLGTIHNTI